MGHYPYPFDEMHESHIVIQHRVVLENLDALRTEFLAIVNGSAVPLNTSGRHELANASDETLPFLLTFDDGGKSAVTRVAGLLEKYGWHGHFFVTAGQINRKGLLNTEQIRRLRREGHVIGSHSFSHPVRMSHCSKEEIERRVDQESQNTLRYARRTD